MTTARAVPTMKKRRSFMMGSVVYHAGAAPHLLEPMARTVVVNSADPAEIKRATRAALEAARKGKP